MADIDRVDERVAHQAADQADDAVGGQHAGGRELVTGRRRALDVVHRLDEVVDAERDRGDEDDADVLEATEHVIDRGQGHREAEVAHRAQHRGAREAAVGEPECGRDPGDRRADRDRHQAARHAAGIAHAAEPVGQDDGEAHHADQRRDEHLGRRLHRDEGDRDAGERAQQGGARRDAADPRRDEAARHQDEALHEHPGEPGLPGLDGIVGRGADRQHDDEHHDEHVRHADARGQGAHVGAAGALGQPPGQPGVVPGAEKQQIGIQIGAGNGECANGRSVC